jgi:hypothetical protein
MNSIDPNPDRLHFQSGSDLGAEELFLVFSYQNLDLYPDPH